MQPRPHRASRSRPVYGPADRRAEPPPPGEFPFTRGNFASGYRGKLWTFRQYSGFGTAEESNRRYRYLLEQGGTGLSVALDLPTQCGYDSDDPEFGEEVGRVGVAVDTLADFEILFDGIPLDKLSTSMTINGTAAILLAFYVAAAERKGIPRAKLTGTIQNDILKEYASRGTWIWPPEPSLRLIADTIEFCAAEVPRFNAISVAGAHFRDAGATAVQEMAFTLADGVTYCDTVVERGRMTIDQFAPADLVLLLHPRRLLRRDRQIPCGTAALGHDRAGTLRGDDGQGVDVPLRLRVRRRVAVRAAGAEQRGAGGLRGDGGGAGWRPVDVHRGLGRAVRAAHRGLHHAGAAYPADPGPRNRCRPASPTRWAARTSSRRSPTPPKPASSRSWPTSSGTAAWSARSRTAICRA